MSNITIRYSKAGIMQYANFITTKDNLNIMSTNFSCAYVSQEDPCFPKFVIDESVNEVIKKIAAFSYNKKAEIWSIDGVKFSAISMHDKYLNSIKRILKEYFDEQIRLFLPKNINIEFGQILLNNKHFRDIQKYVNAYNKANKLSYNILYSLGIVKYYNFEPETTYLNDYLNTLVGLMEN